MANRNYAHRIECNKSQSVKSGDDIGKQTKHPPKEPHPDRMVTRKQRLVFHGAPAELFPSLNLPFSRYISYDYVLTRALWFVLHGIVVRVKADDESPKFQILERDIIHIVPLQLKK